MHVFVPDLIQKISSEMTMPTYGCQVIIQSEQEKQMMKMYRREEKREKKRGKGADDGDPSDAMMPFDPREMRAHRYVTSPDFIFVLCVFMSSCALRLLHLSTWQLSLELYTIKFKHSDA